MTRTPALKYSTGFNLPFSGDELLREFSFINLKNGNTQITAEKSDLNGGGGGTVSLNASGFKLFQTGGNNFGTTSFQGNGQKFFSTPTADTTQTAQVQTLGGAGILKFTQSGTASNQTLKNSLQNLTQGQLLLIGGVVAASVLLIVLLKRKG